MSQDGRSPCPFTPVISLERLERSSSCKLPAQGRTVLHDVNSNATITEGEADLVTRTDVELVSKCPGDDHLAVGADT